MKKIKNKFILFILLLIFLVIWTQLLIKNTISYNDTNSYVVLLKWTWFINDIDLDIDNRNKLEVWDIIKTNWSWSLAIIEWWDWSITRLWWDTVIEINEIDIEKDLTKINIIFQLVSWKTWSNVVSFLWEDSYFKEYFNDIEAGVRWTVFSVDLEKDYIYSVDHDVKLKTKDNKEFIVWSWEAFSIKTFSLLDIKVFFSKIADKWWQDLNQKLDISFLKWLNDDLKFQLEKNNPISFLLSIFSKKYKVLYNVKKYENIYKVRDLINELSIEDKNFVYNKVLSDYQKLNFVENNDKHFFPKKIFLKRVLLYLAKKKDEELLVNSTFNDFKNIIASWDSLWLNDVMNTLDEYKDTFDALDLNLSKYFDSIKIPDSLKDSLEENLDLLKWAFWEKIIKAKFDFANIKDTFNNLKDSAEWKIQDGLNSIYDKIKN